jgi:hypothetical protein
MFYVIRNGILCAAIILFVTIDSSEQCGNKYKNLVILNELFKNNTNVRVPAFLCIPTKRVEQFLRKYSFEIFDKYYEVATRLSSASKTRLQKYFWNIRNIRYLNIRFKYRHIATDVLIADIQSEIQKAFDNFSFDFTEHEKQFFSAISNDNEFLMVRSTGIEDNSTTANAGGNVSVAYVSPLEFYVTSAMGKVVVSYFGAQSLKNRIGGGEILDPTSLTLPVLMQRLIGEQQGGALAQEDIPISGVAYSTNQNLSNTDFKITEIDAAYGHGEGIVANRVATDRYFLCKSRAYPESISIYPMIYYKNQRLIYSLGNRELVAEHNSAQLALQSALSKEQLLHLYNALQTIEQAYGYPVDVEFVVRKNIIYVVQARPTMHKQANPSYVALERFHTADAGDIIDATLLVPGTGSVLIITDPKDIIVAKTLDEADQMANSFAAQAVIVDTWGSALSHAAVNFMSHGTPCLYVQNLNNIQNILSFVSNESPLVIDTQRGLIIFWQNSNQSPKNFIINGWFEHPIQRSLSLYVDQGVALKPFDRPIPKDGKLINLMQSFRTASSIEKRRELLGIINERVEKFIKLTENRMAKLPSMVEKRMKQVCALFKENYTMLLQEIATAIDQKATYFEFLFYHKMLEALLYQIRDESGLLSGYTYSDFLNDIFAWQYTRTYGYARYCSDGETAQQWLEFVQIKDALCMVKTISEEECAAFDAFMHELDQSNNVAIWLASVFYCKVHAQKVTPDLVRKIMKEVVQEYNGGVLTNLCALQKQNALLKIKPNTQFHTIAEAKARWDSIIKFLINPLAHRDFITIFKNSVESRSATEQQSGSQHEIFFKILACNIMHDTVDVLDTTIKTVKISSTIALEQRINLFKDMLNDFMNLFLIWVKDIMPENILTYHKNWPLDDYLGKMKGLFTTIMQNSTSQEMFQRSLGFAVNAAMLGSKTAFDRHYPETAEDIFMLIHQNSLIILAGIFNSFLPTTSLEHFLYIPPILQQVKEVIQNEQSINPIGISYRSDMITLYYNIPLRNHSATLQLMYDGIHQECLCAVQFLGESRDRWEQVAFLARISPMLSNLSLQGEPHFDRQGGMVSWIWHMKTVAHTINVLAYLKIMYNVSYGDDISIQNLVDLYINKNQPIEQQKQFIKTIIQDDIKRFGTCAIAQELLQKIQGI